MNCLRQSGFRKPNPNKPTRLFERHQQEVKTQCEAIGEDVNKIKSDIKSIFNVQMRSPKFFRRSTNVRDSTNIEAQFSDSLKDLHTGHQDNRTDPDYETFNPPSLNRTAFKKHHERPSILKQHQDQANKAYYKPDQPAVMFV